MTAERDTADNISSRGFNLSEGIWGGGPTRLGPPGEQMSQTNAHCS